MYMTYGAKGCHKYKYRYVYPYKWLRYILHYALYTNIVTHHFITWQTQHTLKTYLSYARHCINNWIIATRLNQLLDVHRVLDARITHESNATPTNDWNCCTEYNVQCIWTQTPLLAQQVRVNATHTMPHDCCRTSEYWQSFCNHRLDELNRTNAVSQTTSTLHTSHLFNTATVCAYWPIHYINTYALNTATQDKVLFFSATLFVTRLR